MIEPRAEATQLSILPLTITSFPVAVNASRPVSLILMCS